MSNCELCGEPMPEGEEMFKFHGYSGPCPAPPLPIPPTETQRLRVALKSVVNYWREIGPDGFEECLEMAAKVLEECKA